MFYTYILETADNSYYIGSTANLKDRLKRHQNGQIRYTKSRLPVILVYKEPYNTRAEAVRREKQLKSWKDRAMLESLINTFDGPIV